MARMRASGAALCAVLKMRRDATRYDMLLLRVTARGGGALLRVSFHHHLPVYAVKERMPCRALILFASI